MEDDMENGGSDGDELVPIVMGKSSNPGGPTATATEAEPRAGKPSLSPDAAPCAARRRIKAILLTFITIAGLAFLPKLFNFCANGNCVQWYSRLIPGTSRTDTTNSTTSGIDTTNGTTSVVSVPLVTSVTAPTSPTTLIPVYGTGAFTTMHQLPHQVSPEAPIITFWSNDVHIGPIGDLKDLFGRLYPGNLMRWFDHSFSIYCNFSNTCVKSEKLKSVLSFKKLVDDVVYPAEQWRLNATIAQFYQAFRDDPDIQHVDAFVCSHLIYICRLFVPFGKPIIADVAWTLFEYFDHPDWQTIFDGKYNAVVVNNGFLAQVSSRWTHGLPLKMVPNLCLYTGAKYVGSTASQQKTFMVMRKPWPDYYSAEIFNKMAAESGISASFVPYPKGTSWKEIAEKYTAVVYCPYINSLMVFYETYNMNIPIVIPSMTAAMENGKRAGFGLYSMDFKTVEVFQKIDYYSGYYHNLVFFESTPHMLQLVKTVTVEDYKALSWGMKQRTKVLLSDTLRFWERQLNCVLSNRIPGLSCPWYPRNASLVP